MTRDRQVYLLDPQSLPPETIAVTFAKTSRSPESFREIAAGLTEEKSAEFHEKWVVGYGHASVAEHAVLHIAVENLSRLAVETLESNRLASYTEKSTRYQKWDGDNFYIPNELDGHPLKDLYVQTCANLFETYRQSLPVVRELVAREMPPRPGESEAAWERRARSEYVDVCRFLLPAAALANVGVTLNARTLEYALCKMLSHPLAEVRALGEEMRLVAQAEVPTLVKYVSPLPYLQSSTQSLTSLAAQFLPAADPTDWCTLTDWDSDAEDRILAAALYRFSGLGYAQIRLWLSQASPEQRQAAANALFAELGPHDTPFRELEYASFTFDLLLDQGAYNELKRHRMMTQTPQPLTARLGFAIPRRITAAGLEGSYIAAMQAAAAAYEQIAAFNPHVASYLVPNGFNRRVLLSFNLRSAYHFLELRSAPNAHFSIRRVARRMTEQLQTRLPLLTQALRVSPDETWQQIERDYFTRTA